MKRKVVIILFLFFSKVGLSQDYPPLLSQYLMDDKLLTSPAWAGYSDAFQLRTSYLQQWVGIVDAPSSFNLSLNGMALNNVGLGTILHSDKSAFSSQLRAQFSFSYHIDMSYKKLKILSFGVSAIYQENTLDQSKFSNVADPSVSGNIVTVISPNFNLGILYRYGDFYTSLNIDNLIPKSVIDNLSLIEPRVIRNYYLLSGYQHHYSETFTIEPSVMVNYVESESNSHIDLNVKFIQNSKKNRHMTYWLGLSYRSSFTVYNMDYNPNNLTVIFGGKYKNYSYGVSYTYGLTEISKKSNGSYLFSLGYDFLQWYRRKLCNCNTDKYKYY